LIAITKGKARVLFVGITCGFRCVHHYFVDWEPQLIRLFTLPTPLSLLSSAGYVAGQLVYAMSQPHFSSVLLGFNPGTGPLHVSCVVCRVSCIVCRVAVLTTDARWG
jgi:hypothetical protein